MSTTLDFSFTNHLNRDVDKIKGAMDLRSKDLASQIKSQKLIKKVCLVAFQVLALASFGFAIATFPASVLLLSIKPLFFGALCLALGISCFVADTYLNPKSPGEWIVRQHGCRLFKALKKGNGEDIIRSTQEFAEQSKKRKSSFDKCLGKLNSPDDASSFIHKSRLYGYLLCAVENLDKKEYEAARENAKKGLGEFALSGFKNDVAGLLTSIKDDPKDVEDWIKILSSNGKKPSVDDLINQGRQFYSNNVQDSTFMDSPVK